MRRIGFIWIVGIFLLLFVVPVSAQEIPDFNTDSLTMDSIAIDSLDPDPEWYVAPVIPASLRAPMRASAAAASCNRVEAIQIFDIDSVLTEGTYYEYDDRGNVISTTVWAYALDGTMTGKSKNEYAFDNAGTQTMTAVYEWDNAANDWKGTEKYEYAYGIFAGEKKMTSNTSFVWLNGAWVANQRYTYSYDEAGREIEYYEYIRNTISNDLQPFKGHIQTWTNDLQTLDILYTSYANGQWTAGTKKEWAFDEGGTQTMYATYSMSNGAWVGSSKETWTYGGPSAQLTLHEKYGWANNDWSKILKEETEYAGANIIRIENYSYTNGVARGTKKETWGFANGKQTLHQAYTWLSNAWSLSLQEETEYSGANIVRVENYSYTNGVATGTKKEEYTYTGGKKTEFVTYAWLNGTWANATKETWDFTNGKQTLHEQFVGEDANWSKTLREENEYDGANLIRVENYSYANGVTTGTKKETYAYSGSGKETIVYAWENDAWIENTKEVWGYTSGKQTLHETYEWYNDGWLVTLRELSGYDAAGNKNSIENYTGSEGVLIGTQKEEYTFNSAKEVIVTVKYKWSEGVWVGDTKNEAGYREGNTEYSEANYTWNGSAWVGTGNKTVTEYYAEDKVSAAWAYAWSSVAGDWVYAARRICEYDGKGRSIGDTTYTYSNGAWGYYKLQTHGFDSHDNDTLAVTATWNGAEWMATFIAKGTYTYTPSGDPLLVETYTGVEGSWVGDKKIIFEYNTKGSQTLYYEYEWKNGWINKKKTEKGYDSNNNLIFTQSYTWNGSTWKGSSKYEYSYDDFGFSNMSAHYVWIGGKWQGLTRTDKINSSEGVELSTISFSWENNGWVATLKTDYIRINDRIVEKLVSRYRNNQWQNYQRYIWNYDLYDREIFYSEERWKNENWQKINIKKSQYDEYCASILRNQIEGSWNTSGIVLSYTDNHYFYNCDPHFYTVRFVNYDGRVLANMTAQEGETPTYVGSNPTREGNAEYSYTFSGWNPTLGPVTSNVTYTATFTANKNIYTITWKNEDGTLIDQTTAEYGTMPTHEDASKANTAEYTYTFAGWTPGIGIVTGDAEYTATFTAAKNKYTVTFKDEDGTTLKSEELEYGVTPTAPADPTKAATGGYLYTFSGWTPSVVPVTSEATYTATFTSNKRSYTITWLNEDGSEIAHETLEYGATPAHANINKESTAEFTYTFAGWTPGIGIVTGDATYTAQFSATKNSYYIIWLNDDNTEIDRTLVEYGVVPTHTAPTKEATDEHSYFFDKWTPDVVAVTGEATYKATYTETTKVYTITWLNEDGSEISHETLEYGATPSHVDPTKEATDEFTYTFAGWNPAVTSVTGDATYTATFSQTKRSYTITWLNEDGSEIEHETLEYGATPSHADVTKENTAEYTYTFAGWAPGTGIVTGDASYTATFSATKNSYTITWLNEDGSEIEHETLEYGATPSHADVTKESTAEYTYAFAGWTPQITAVTCDAEYTATFTATKNKYLITFKNEDGTTLKSEELEYGVMPTAPANPTKAATAEWTYTFAGWDKEIISVAEATTYTATYTTTKNSYTITWLNDDLSQIDQTTVEYGVVPTHEDPTKQPTAQYGYTFAGWSPAISAVTGNATYKATYTDTINQYTISWLDDIGTLVDQTKVAYGATPAHANIYKESDDQYDYAFVGWTPTIVPVTGDASYSAIFTTAGKSYTVTFYLEDGVTILDQMTLPYGAIPSTPYIPSIPSDANHTYTFSGWNPEIAPVTGDISYVPTFTAIPNQYTVIFRNYNGKELQRKKVDYGTIPEYEGDEPSRPATNAYTWAFEGWTPELTAVVGDATYTAVYTKVMNTYTILFYDEDGITLLDEVTVEHGQKPTTSVIPTKEADEEYRYTFAGWSPKIAKATADAEYTATYTATPKTQDLNNTEAEGAAIKVIIEDKIYIRRGGNTYSIDGQRVK